MSKPGTWRGGAATYRDAAEEDSLQEALGRLERLQLAIDVIAASAVLEPHVNLRDVVIRDHGHLVADPKTAEVVRMFKGALEMDEEDALRRLAAATPAHDEVLAEAAREGFFLGDLTS